MKARIIALTIMLHCLRAGAFTPPPLVNMQRRGLSATCAQSEHGRAEDADIQTPSRRDYLNLITAATMPLLLGGLSQKTMAASGDVVLVIGATGGIGQYVCRELLQRGYRVRGLTRRPAEAENILKGLDIEWMRGDLNKKADLAPAIKGVKHVIFAAGAHGFEDIENNRRIYAEAIGEAARLGKEERIDRFLVISSAGVDMMNPNSPNFQPQVRVSKYLKDVLVWKLRGEQLVKASGVPYTIVRAYSLNNNAANIERNKDDTAIAILQGDPEGVGGVITRKNLAQVSVEALLLPQTQGVTFEVLDVRKSLNPDYPDWLKILREDLDKDPALSQSELAQLLRPPPGTSASDKDIAADEPGPVWRGKVEFEK